MQQNIIKSLDASKIYFTYTDGKGLKKRELVTLRYTDEKRCYFACNPTSVFNKPGWRAKADLQLYTQDGVYSAQVIIRDSSFSQSELIFEVDIPKTWSLKQLRSGTRKNIALPFKLIFDDNFELEDMTLDLAVGGFSFRSKHEFTSAQRNLSARCTIHFLEDHIVDFPDKKMECVAKFVRQKLITDEYDYNGFYRYSFKFINLPSTYVIYLKDFLMKIR